MFTTKLVSISLHGLRGSNPASLWVVIDKEPKSTSRVLAINESIVREFHTKSKDVAGQVQRHKVPIPQPTVLLRAKLFSTGTYYHSCIEVTVGALPFDEVRTVVELVSGIRCRSLKDPERK